MASHFFKEAIMIFLLVLAAVAMLIGLAVMFAALVYVIGIFVCGLSLAVRKYEAEIRTVLNAGDICKKRAKQAFYSFRKTPGQRGAVIDSKR